MDFSSPLSAFLGIIASKVKSGCCLESRENELNIPHIPVLAEETVGSFSGVRNGWIVDCTIGYGGHTEALLERYPEIGVVGIDRDAEAISFCRRRLERYGERVRFVRGSFASRVGEVLDSFPISGILADFGVSSLQLDKRERGFSFDSDTLDMRMDSDSGFSAYDLVNGYGVEMLERIFREYGELGNRSARLAEKIVEARSSSPIGSARRLSEISIEVLGTRGRIHPATLVFQAIRIEVNDELGEIESLLDTLERKRPDGATVSLITFHSLEDRLVKRRFSKWSKGCICHRDAMRCTCGGDHSLGRPASRKPVTASAKEISDNPRSRSAKLRTFHFSKGVGPDVSDTGSR
jgi:16S rRNA (cytosine1402-N4)-methyltransferase